MEKFGGYRGNDMEDDGAHLEWTPERVSNSLKENHFFLSLSQEYPWYPKAISNIANRFVNRNLSIGEVNGVLAIFLERRIMLSKIDERGKDFWSRLKHLGSISEGKVERDYLRAKEFAQNMNPDIREDFFNNIDIVLDEYFPKRESYEKISSLDDKDGNLVIKEHKFPQEDNPN